METAFVNVKDKGVEKHGLYVRFYSKKEYEMILQFLDNTAKHATCLHTGENIKSIKNFITANIQEKENNTYSVILPEHSIEMLMPALVEASVTASIGSVKLGE